jgi:hypothetical protein
LIGGEMKSIFVPNESFENKDEIKSINNYLYKNDQVLLEEIDDQTEIWIIGNKDQEFFEKQTEQAYTENRVLDPMDNIPIGKHRTLQHIAVINHKFDSNSDLNSEIIYANSDFDIADFVHIVIDILKKQYPKNKANAANNEDIKHRKKYALAG